MAGAYLLPEDVSAEHARQVLDFINQAASAQVIAEAVEFPNELDVGLRIAQRILNRRAELNGFTTLDQLYAVPFVGPERFTEIVVSLSGAHPPRGTDVSASDLVDLRRSIDALRSMIQPAVQVRIWSVQDTIWLGQGATVLLQITEGGRPRIDQPVTVTSSWGELTALNGVQLMSGNTVTTRTNEVGLAEIRLRVRFQAPLSDAQRLSLERAAALLPATAHWPGAAGAQLGELVQRYRAPGSDDLREAIDAAFREYGSSLERTEHRGQALAQWALVPVGIVCFAHDDGDERGRQHLALGTHTLIVRNWLPAFLATFEGEVANDKALAAELARAPRSAADANDFLNDVFISVHSYLNTERGALGRAIRTRVTERELQQFMQAAVPALPAEAQLAALTGVRDASKTIGDGGLTMFTAVDVNRRDKLSTFEFDASVLADRVAQLETTAVTTQQLDQFRAEVLDLTRAEVTTGILDAQAAQEVRIQQVANAQAQLSQQVAALSTSTTGLRADVASLSSSVAGLNTRVSRDLSTVGARLDDIDGRLPRR